MTCVAQPAEPVRCGRLSSVPLAARRLGDPRRAFRARGGGRPNLTRARPVPSRSRRGRERLDGPETLTLLEAIEPHGEDWSSVASRVATKNAEQCVRRFARLPSRTPSSRRSRKGAVVDATPSETPSEETPPRASNPVMAVVAFSPPRRAARRRGGGCVRSRAWPAAGDGGGAEGDGADAGGEDLELGPAPPVTREQAVVASAEGLAAAAVHAKLLADRDEHEMEKLAVGVVEMQMRKIELKLRQMEDLDAGLARERAAVDRMFAAIAAERGREEKTRKEAEARVKSAEEEGRGGGTPRRRRRVPPRSRRRRRGGASQRACWLRRRRPRGALRRASRFENKVCVSFSSSPLWSTGPSCVPIRPYSISGATPPRRRI